MNDEPIQIIAYEIIGTINGYGSVDNWTNLCDGESYTYDYVHNTYAKSERPWSMLCVYDLGPLGDPYSTVSTLLAQQNERTRLKLDRCANNNDFGMF